MTTKEKIDAIFSDQYMEDVINSVKCMLRNQMTKRQLREMIFYMVEGEYPYIDCSDMRPTKVSDKLQDALLSIQEEILFTEEKFIDALRHFHKCVVAAACHCKTEYARCSTAEHKHAALTAAPGNI